MGKAVASKIFKIISLICLPILLIITIDLIGALFGVSSLRLQKIISIIPLTSFIVLVAFQLIFMVLKLYAYPRGSLNNDIWVEYPTKDNSIETAILTKDKVNRQKKQQAIGIIHVSRWVEAQQSVHVDNNNKNDSIIGQKQIGNQNITAKQQFFVNDEWKNFFQNEMHACYVAPDESDESVVRHFTSQMSDDAPFFIADVSHVVKQYGKWMHYLPRVKPFYAIKTNAHSFIIKIIGKMGGGFDCASIEELNAILSVYPDIDCSKRIIYAHPCKTISHMIYFKNRNVQLTVADNAHELIKIKKHWPNAKVLIRLKTKDSQSAAALSQKFGANERVAIELIDLAKKLNVELVGCAFHVGSGCYDNSTFRDSLEFARRLFDVAKRPEYNFNFTILDIGGGFPGIDIEGKPTFARMAEGIHQTLDELFSESEDLQVIAEPGRYFAAASVNLVTSIISVRLNNKNYSDYLSVKENQELDIITADNAEILYYINDGIYGSFGNILFEKAVFAASCLRKHNRDLSQCTDKEYNSAVFGPTCDSNDCLSPSVDLPLMDIGDYIWFYHVGAYSSTTSTRFNGFFTEKIVYIWKD